MTVDRITILLVCSSSKQATQDRDKLQELVGDVLQMDAVGNLGAARTKLEKKHFDCILLGSSALFDELLADLNTLRKVFPATPVIAVTPDQDDKSTEILLDAGAQDVVTSEVLRSKRIVQLIRFAKTRQHSLGRLVGAEAKLRKLMKTKPYIVIETDIDFYIVAYDGIHKPNASRPGWDLQAGYNILDFIALEDRKRALNHVEKILRGEELGIVQYVALNQAGSRFPIFLEFERIMKDAMPVGIRISLLDVGERRRAEAERKRLLERLSQNQKMETLGLMVSGVAHDLNNMLGAIMIMVSNLEENPGPPEQTKEDLHMMLGTCERGTELIQTLLRFAHDKQTQSRRFSVNHLVREVELLLKHTISRKLEVIVDLETGPTFVEGNPSQINHAIMNLCINGSNAMKANGKLTVRTGRAAITSPEDVEKLGIGAGEYVIVKVEDNGCGMTPETIEHAFDPFFTTSTNKKGNGLGLPMVLNTIKGHNGAITINSVRYEGTTMTIYLPAANAQSVIPASPRVSSGISVVPEASDNNSK